MSATRQSKPELQQFVFDDMIVDCLNFEVRRAGQVVSLTPRAFDVLVFLLENRGRVVEKSQLFEHVWKERFVSDNALSRAIKEIRHTLGDNADTPKYIETVPRRGYRFIATVDVNSDELTRLHDFARTTSTHEHPHHPTTLSQPFLPGTSSSDVSRRWLLLIVGLTVVAALTAGRWWSERPTKVTPKPVLARNAQITTWTGLDIFPTISPDGNMVIYSSDRTGKFELYSRALTVGARENQLTSDGKQNLEPSWSPDGKWIAYYSQLNGGIWIIPAGGGVARQLVDFGSRPTWSHDGSKIAFQSDGLSDISNLSAIAPTSSIWTVSVSGGDAHQITHPNNPIGGHGSPGWSVDGQRIAFVANDTLSSVVWSISLKNGQLKQVTKSDQYFFDPVFMPDGKNLLVASGGIWRIPLSPNGDPAGEPEALATPTQAQVRTLSFSADGKKVVSSLLRQRGNLWSVHLDREKLQASVPSPFVEDTSMRKTGPLFSGDGGMLAYNVWVAGATGSVWTVNAKGGDGVQLTAEPGGVVGWSPDNTSVLSVVFKEDNPILVSTSLVTRVSRTIATLPRRMPFSRLSPDGKILAFNSYADGAVNIWLHSIDTGTTRQLTFDRELLGFPAWSPDGKWIAAELKRKDDTYVALIPVDGGAPSVLNSDRGQSWTGTFSPDGDKIAFAAARDGIWNLWWISRSTKEQKQLTAYTKPNAFVRYPTWSPTGDQIVYEYSETTGNVWLGELK